MKMRSRREREARETIELNHCRRGARRNKLSRLGLEKRHHQYRKKSMQSAITKSEISFIPHEMLKETILIVSSSLAISLRRRNVFGQSQEI
jgi:hypothetical protein